MKRFGGRPRVALVEDDFAIAHLLKEVLTLEGFDVVVITDGQSARARLLAEPVDVVVLDVMLPGLDGIEVLKEVRAKHGHDIPVLILSALDDDKATWRGWTAGCDLYLTKPFDPNAVVAAVRKLAAA